MSDSIPSQVESRFYVTKVTRFPGDTYATVELGAACRGDHNRKWSSATPSGGITMNITNMAAVATFDKWRAESLDVAITFEAVKPVTYNDGHPFRPTEVEPGQSWPPAGSCGECGSSEDNHK